MGFLGFCIGEFNIVGEFVIQLLSECIPLSCFCHNLIDFVSVMPKSTPFIIDCMASRMFMGAFWVMVQL